MSSSAHKAFLKEAPDTRSLSVVQPPSLPLAIPQAKVRHRRAGWRLGTWRLPQDVFYVMAVSGVAALSWDRWQSGYGTVISALAASAFTIVLEMVLAVTRPQAHRALFGIRGAVWILYALTVVVGAALLIVSLMSVTR